MKILSFVIPAYNSEIYLDKCVSSMITPETLDKVEVIIVNDGSTDGTTAVADRYCVKYPDSVRLISQENKGHGGALNTGCAAATGKYIKVVDADDSVFTENLKEFISLLELCESDVVLTHHSTINVSTGEIKNWRNYPPEFAKSYTFDEIMPNWKSFDRSLTFHGITYNREFYRKYGISLSEHVFYEDHEYATFPCCHAKTVTPFDLIIYNYRVGDASQSVSETNQLKRIGHVEAVLKKMLEGYAKFPDDEPNGKFYIAMKIQGLLLSYLTTVLLVESDKKTGRSLAARQMDICKQAAPKVYELTKSKYNFFTLLNRLHIQKSTWDKLLNSGVYNKLRHNHDFE